MKNILLYISITLCLSACFEPDEVLPAVKSNTLSIDIDLTQNQAAFLDLHNINASSTREFQDWQLKFQNEDNKWSIYLNTLSQVAVYNTRITKYDSINEYFDTRDVVWQLDIPTSTGLYPGIGTWGDYTFEAPKSYKNVFLVRWVENGVTQVFKLQVLDARKGAYHIRYGTLDGAYINSVWVEKSEERQHSYYSIAQGKVLPYVEPPKNKWNICFSYLTDSIVRHPGLPYITTPNPAFGIFQGVLINQANSAVYLDTFRSFQDISYFNSNDLEFKMIDELYNIFSYYNSSTNEVAIKEKIVLIIKDRNDLFAIKPRNLTEGLNSSISIDLELKKL